MKDQNSWCGTGRLCSDPELKYTPSGVAVCSIRIAVNKGKEEGGKSADFLNVELWRGAAEFCANYLKKGAQVAVQGRIRVRDWVAQDGTKRNTVEIVANEFNALGTKAGEHEPQRPVPPVEVDETLGEADSNDPFADA